MFLTNSLRRQAWIIYEGRHAHEDVEICFVLRSQLLHPRFANVGGTHKRRLHFVRLLMDAAQANQIVLKKQFLDDGDRSVRRGRWGARLR